eukprot:1196142-Prorocentrum_minimum.AAC.2
MRALVELGADYNVKNADGHTPLHVAASYGNVETVRTLVELGADSSLQNDNGETPMYVAAHNGHRAVGKYLRRPPPKQQRTDLDPTAQAAAAALAEAMAAALIAEEEDQNQEAASTSRVGKPRARKNLKSRAKASAEAEARSSAMHAIREQQLVSARTKAEKERERKERQRQCKRADVRAALKEALALVGGMGARPGAALEALEAAVEATERMLKQCGNGGAEAWAEEMWALVGWAKERTERVRGKARAAAEAAAMELLEEALVRSVVDESYRWGGCASGGAGGSAEEAAASGAAASAGCGGARGAEDGASSSAGTQCVVCLSAPKDSLVLPCKHMAMCADCMRAVWETSRLCLVCRARISHCVYNIYV